MAPTRSPGHDTGTHSESKQSVEFISRCQTKGELYVGTFDLMIGNESLNRSTTHVCNFNQNEDVKYSIRYIKAPVTINRHYLKIIRELCRTEKQVFIGLFHLFIYKS